MDLLQPRVGLVAAARRLDLIALGLEIIAEQHRERLLVFDDKNARIHAKSCYLSAAVRNAAIVVVSPFGR